MIKIYAALGLLFVTLSCTTQPSPPPQPQPDTVDGVSYLSRGKQVLTQATDAGFISLVNTYHTSYKKETNALFDLYVNRQRALFSYFRSKGDYFQAQHHLNNMAAFTNINTADTEQFYIQFINHLVQRRELTTARFLAEKHNLPLLVPPIEWKPPADIRAYNTILAEISVRIRAQDKDDIPRVSRSFGTGFLVSPTQVLTAYHVVEPALNSEVQKATITVKIQDKILENASVAAYDALTDIALLKLDKAQPFPFKIAEMFGDSADLRQGDTVYCLGHHRGFTSTLTRGIVSAVHRKAPEVGTWIQVDANVAPGASGGLLIGADLKIYGMVVAGLLFEDINFAVPSLSICEVLDRLRAGESPKRPWIGMLLEQPRFKTWDPKIIEVFPTSPLSRLGIDVESILLEINHQRMRTIAQAQETINMLEAGNIVHVKIKLGTGADQDYWVMLERRPEFAIYNATRQYNQIASLYSHFGLKIDTTNLHTETVTVNMKNIRLNFYRVEAVREDSFLDDQGVRRGDYVGIIDDYYDDKDRYLEILHLSRIATPSQIKDIRRYIYRLKKSKYDENIL